MTDDDHGITLADVIANRETMATNIRHQVAVRSRECGMTPADYLAKMLLPQLASNGVSIDELKWIVSLFEPRRESDSLT